MNRFRRLSIRWRITIGSVLVAAILLTAAALFFRTQIEQVQLNSDKKLLYSASTPYIAEIRNHPTRIDQPAGEEHVAVINPKGHIVATNLPDELTDRVTVFLRLDSGSRVLTIGHEQYLVTIEEVRTSAGVWRIVGTRNQDLSEEVLANLTNILFIGAGVLLLGFGTAAWLLTTAALRPVERMRRRAEELRVTGVPEPLPVGPAQDELSDLATTLNEFIASIRVTAAREKQMVSDASHELRTPLAVLGAQLELARLSEGDATALLHDLELAESTVGRMSAIATNLLELSALESDAGADASSWQQLVDAFTEASDRARLLALPKHIVVEFEVENQGSPAELDEGYAISATHIGRILDNLISNAIRAVPEAGTIVARLDQVDGALKLAVEDDGPGVPDSFVPVAFDRFTRPDEDRGVEGGSGLGLSIVAAIVRNAGGTVRIANRASGGLRVDVTLPASGESVRP